MDSPSGQTRRTETSQYPQEKTPEGIPPVAASERGRCPNRLNAKAPTVVESGLWDRSVKALWSFPGVKSGAVVEWHWNGRPKRVKAP